MTRRPEQLVTSTNSPHAAAEMHGVYFTEIGSIENQLRRWLPTEQSVLSSCSVVITEQGAQGIAAVDSFLPAKIPQLRFEFLGFDHPEDPDRFILKERLRQISDNVKMVRRPAGGRVAALAQAIESAQHEFVVIPIGGFSSGRKLLETLVQMWAIGGDIGIIGAPITQPITMSASTPPQDPAILLAQQLLMSSGAAPTAIIARRWVARWLFHELLLSIDQVNELADRARLMGVHVIHYPTHDRPAVVALGETGPALKV